MNVLFWIIAVATVVSLVNFVLETRRLVKTRGQLINEVNRELQRLAEMRQRLAEMRQRLAEMEKRK